MKIITALSAAALAVLLTACAGGAASSEQKMADSVTRAVYDDNYAGVTANFDDALKPEVTRTQVAQLSDVMHKLGDYQGVTMTSNDTVNKRFDFEAKFSKGTMTVKMRLDPDGKIAAYRVVPSGQQG